MAINRRHFLLASLATMVTGCAGRLSRYTNHYFLGAKEKDRYFVYGLNQQLQTVFRFEVPSRVHGFARSRSHAVAFARRPGEYFIVFDGYSGQVLKTVANDAGAVFNGHGVYSQDGRWLFATENNFHQGRGMIGRYDVNNNYQRVDSFNSGGIGPHDIALLSDGKTLVVANGGVKTHPTSDRAKLNMDDIRSNLSYLDSRNGRLLSSKPVASDSTPLSLRHLSVNAYDQVAFAMQYYGSKRDVVPLVGIDRGAEQLALFHLPNDVTRSLKHYCGDVVFDRSERSFWVSAPRGNRLLMLDNTGQLLSSMSVADGCGLAAYTDERIIYSSGQGLVAKSVAFELGHEPQEPGQWYDVHWDNHIG